VRLRYLIATALVTILASARMSPCQCPVQTDPVDGGLSLPSLNPIKPGDKFITGNVAGAVSGSVQLCNNGMAIGGPHPVAPNGDFSVAVGAAIAAGTTITAQFWLLPAPAHPSAVTTVVLGPAAADPTTKLEAMDKQIRVAESDCIKKRDAFCLASVDYSKFVVAVTAALAPPNPLAPLPGQNWFADYTRRQHWLISTVHYRHDQVDPGKIPISNFAFALPGDLTGNVTHARIMAGIDVSAASSADPAAKFLGEADLDVPLPGRGTTSPIGANDWIWGYARISSIAQPSAINGTTNLPSYVQPLTSSAPNSIVQSFETTAGYELRMRELTPTAGPDDPSLYRLFSAAALLLRSPPLNRAPRQFM
jgi:hypothetical protein